jgi:hypothetical protein
VLVLALEGRLIVAEDVREAIGDGLGDGVD